MKETDSIFLVLLDHHGATYIVTPTLAMSLLSVKRRKSPLSSFVLADSDILIFLKRRKFMVMFFVRNSNGEDISSFYRHFCIFTIEFDRTCWFSTGDWNNC